MNTVKQGNDFAEEIADLYRLMGYDVTLNIDIDGQQVDILASTNVVGGGLYNQIVECKYKSNNTPVSNDDVQSIAKAFAISQLLHNVTSCVIVTNSNFSLKAKEVATKAGVFLKTKDDLIYELIDFRVYLNKVKDNFKTAFMLNNQSWYIESYIKNAKGDSQSLVEYVDKWLDLPEKHPLVIKGSYGSGKSSFCSYYSHRLIASGKKIIPIVIQLRDYHKAIKIENVIRDFLTDECELTRPRYEVFNKMFDKGNILIFFDGLDEMATKVDSTVLEANLLEIEKYSRKGNVILTCRPEYFVSEKEEKDAWFPNHNFLSERLSTYQIVELQEWNLAQITHYVEVRLQFENDKQRIAQCLNAIKNLPELNDLSTRAVHLELIVKMLPIMFKEDIPINRSNLYRTYIKSELMREVVKNKRLRLITDNERFDLMKEVAAINHLYGHSINFDTASNVISNYVEIPKSELEIVTRDFLNRSFLIRKEDNYFFAHKSIAEFLVAVKIIEQISLDNFNVLTNEYSPTTASMAIEMLGGIENINDVISLLKIEHNPQKLTDEMFAKYAFFLSGAMEFFHKVGRRGSVNFTMLAHDYCLQFASLFSLRWYERRHNHKRSYELEYDTLRIWNLLFDQLQILHRIHVNVLKGTYTYIQNRQLYSLHEILRLCIIPYSSYNINIWGEDVVALLDKDTVSRIFGNLISNAVRAAGEKGILNITLLKKKKLLKKAKIIITFENNGPEIPKENLQRIFSGGFTTRQENRDHHGLGLYIVQSLLDEIGGEIKVISTSESTSFTIELDASS